MVPTDDAPGEGKRSIFDPAPEETWEEDDDDPGEAGAPAEGLAL